jgi:hypothetical protein
LILLLSLMNFLVNSQTIYIILKKIQDVNVRRLSTDGVNLSLFGPGGGWLCDKKGEGYHLW